MNTFNTFVCSTLAMMMTFGFLMADEQLGGNKQAAPQKTNCHCPNCECTPEAHCGCYSDQGCHCGKEGGCQRRIQS